MHANRVFLKALFCHEWKTVVYSVLKYYCQMLIRLGRGSVIRAELWAHYHGFSVPLPQNAGCKLEIGDFFLISIFNPLLPSCSAFSELQSPECLTLLRKVQNLKLPNCITEGCYCFLKSSLGEKRLTSLFLSSLFQNTS